MVLTLWLVHQCLARSPLSSVSFAQPLLALRGVHAAGLFNGPGLWEGLV